MGSCEDHVGPYSGKKFIGVLINYPDYFEEVKHSIDEIGRFGSEIIWRGLRPE